MYSKDSLEACRQVLKDVVSSLSDYADMFYLIGGWAVYYLLDRPDRTPEAIGFAGTEDVDLAFLVPMAELERIMERLGQKGYQRSASQRMLREVSGKTVIVDLLGGKPEVKASFTFKKRISGRTLAGEAVDMEVSVVNLPACLILKARAFDENPKDKDAYDIYYLVTHGGVEDGDAAREMKSVLQHPLIAEGMKLLHYILAGSRARDLEPLSRCWAASKGKRLKKRELWLGEALGGSLVE